MNQKQINILLNKHAIRVFHLRCKLNRSLIDCKCYVIPTVIENHIEATKHKMDLIRGVLK